MKLDLKELEGIVERTIGEQKANEALRVEVSRVLGPSVVTECCIEEVALNANNVIDVMERTGKGSYVEFSPAVSTQFAGHADAQVRKLAARTVPQSYLPKMSGDKSPTVRAAVAARAQLSTVREMMKKFPSDDQLRSIYKARHKKHLMEAGLPTPEIQDEPFDMYGDERLGDAVKQWKGPELSDTWYGTKAFKLVQDYDNNIEGNWEELAVKRFCRSSKATSGTDIDEDKLLKAVQQLRKEKDERAMERDALRETLEWLASQEKTILENTTFGAVVEETDDAVETLMREATVGETFIDKANVLFRVKEATLPPGIKKYRLGEGSSIEVKVPVIGFMPSSVARAIDERAMDAYCKHWNDRQAMRGEPLKLEWSYHPDSVGKVGFNVTLK